MSSGFVKSASLHHQQEPEAGMENLLARVSKKLVIQEIESHKSNSPWKPLVPFAEYKRVLAVDLDFDDVRFIFVSSRTLWLRIDDDDSASIMKTTVQGIGNEIGLRFTGGGKGFLIDALGTALEQRKRGLWAFDWKQRYSLA